MDHLRLLPLEEEPLGEPVIGDPSLRKLGSGTAGGVEASWSWSRGAFATVGSYRWSRATRTVENVDYVPRFHRDHELEFGAALDGGGSMWSARFSLRSGQPTTPALAVIPVGSHGSAETRETRWVVFEGDYNAGRLPPYRRLDLGWRRIHQDPAGALSVTPFVSVANLFAAPNVAAGWTRVVPGREGRETTIERKYLPQMPVLVFFGLEFRF